MSNLSDRHHFSVFETPFGRGVVIVRDNVLTAVRLPMVGYELPPVEGLELTRLSCSPLSNRAAQMVERYFAGEHVLFDLPLSTLGKTDFQRVVLEIVRAIPYGSVMTYGEVARLAGTPRGARAVGNVMASNDLPIVVPCHRVVGASGEMTGYTASGGLEMKRWLLALEGVCIGKQHTVERMSKFMQIF